MTKTLTVEGDVTTANTRTSLTAQGSVSAPSLVTPAGVSRITKIIVGAAADLAAAGGAVFLIRLDGPAVLGGEQTIIVAGQGGQAPQAGSDQATSRVILTELDVDIAVSPTEVIAIAAEMAGDDLGNARVAVTLVFA